MKRKNLFLVLFISFTAPVFAQEADKSLIPYRRGDLWGYSDVERKVIIQPVYTEANLFYGGYACVKKDKMYGYIDTSGKLVIPFKFYSAKSFRRGYISPADKQKTVLFAKVSLQPKGVEICIDSTGAKLVKCPTKIDSRIGGESKPVNDPAEPNYSNIPKSNLFDRVVGGYKMMAADDTYYIAVKDKNYGVVKNKTEVIIPFEYSGIKKINGNVKAIVYLLVEKNGMKGVYFGTGSPYIAVENNNLVSVCANNGKDYFIITKDGKSSLKNTSYQEVVPPDYTRIVYDSTGGFVLMTDTLKGYYFYNSLRVEPKYNDVKLVDGGEYIMVKTKMKKMGYVNRKGEEYFEE
jgi:hypothetical protein